MKKWLFLSMIILIGAFFISCGGQTTTETTTQVSTTTDEANNSTEKTFIVTFFVNGNDIGSFEVVEGNTITVPSLEYQGCSLDGWYLSNDGGASFSVQWSLSSPVDEDLELYANLIPNSYTITFVSNGGSAVPSLTQEYTSAIYPPSIPTKEGFEFSGWFSDEELTEEYVFTTMPYENITLYAKWSPLTFEINYYILPEGFNPLVDEIVLEEPNFTNVSLGGEFTVALTVEHEVFAWGDSTYGQLGNGSFISKYRPVNITGNFDLEENDYIVQIATGYLHAAALSHMGKVFLWGDNEYGQLGTGDLNTYLLPIDITASFNLSSEEKIIEVECGNYFSSAITSSGRLFTWGDNNSGQLGDGSTVQKALPNEITSNFDLLVDELIIDVSLGSAHALALTSTNRVFSWGYNFSMQLGDGTNVSRNTPLDITSSFTLSVEEAIQQIAAGNHHSAIVTTLGNVFTFGFNIYGQLGDGTTVNKGIPTNITGQFTLNTGEKIERIMLGVHTSAAVTNQSSVFTWGKNSCSELGDGTTIDSPNPINISSLFSFSNELTVYDISLGDSFMAVVDSEGTMYLWGDNYEGKLGIGSTTLQSTPQNPVFMIPEVITIEYIQNESYDFLLPERVGDTFIGWYLDLALTTQFEEPSSLEGSHILYSKWSSYPAIILEETVYLDVDDIHYYYFTLEETTIITAYTISEIDTYGTLLDSEENIIVENDDSDDSDYNFLIEYLLEPGTYTIAVRAYDNLETGDYTIVIIKN